MRLNGIVVGGLAVSWCTAAVFAAAGAPAPAGKKPAKPTAPAGMPAAAPAGAAVSPEAAEFFEKQIRPVLAENCYTCHGPKLAQSGLRVDSRAGLLRGADGGRPSIVMGDPDKSPLIQAIRQDGALKMPPGKKLPQASIDALTQWVKMGAPWPGAEKAPAPSAPRPHWAFQPVTNPKPPAVKLKSWVKSPIDQFVLATLEKKGMVPNRTADRRTLIRRAYFDLIGLPPTQAEIQAFVQDKSPTAFATVVDRLLADPRYGERYARYWLDVARYADTKGYVFTEERRYTNAYTYRDWVINSLNADLGYDQFLIQQLAADQLPQGEDKRPLAAMGFLTLGRRFLNNIADITDDRIDTVFRGTQALTVGCARCHDHKFDPIPTADYYSLYGVFASSTEPREGPILASAEKTAEYTAYEKQVQALDADVQTFLRTKHGEMQALAKSKIAESMLAAREANGGNLAAVSQKANLPAELVRRWQKFLGDTRGNHHPIFAPWHTLSALPDGQFATQAPALAAAYAANKDTQKLLNPAIAAIFAGAPPANLADVAARYAKVLGSPSNDQQIEHALDSIGGPLNFDMNQVEPFLNAEDRSQLQARRQKLDQVRSTAPAAPPRAMVLLDTPNPMEPRIFKRGNPNNQGDKVPRQFLAVLSGPERKPFQKGSGRLEMAQAIANRNNPLTARVMVNRVWMWHNGMGLVRTPSDFGLRSEAPSNPELLDYLASYLMDNGWSLKKLHRLIMLSSTYQQSSDDKPQYRKQDPDNSLFWKANRRRLDFESMRDSLLFASGELDTSVGGPSVDLVATPSTTRRSVYGFIDRQNLPNLFRTFDFASPDTHSPQRFETSVPQQALFMMNSPFIVDRARKLLARPEIAKASQPAEKIAQLYRTIYSRDPEADELALGLKYLTTAEAPAPAAAGPGWQFGFGQVDDAAGRVKTFQALTHFTGSGYQGGASMPDPKTGWCMLTAAGGHAGNDQAHATIRRWVAPMDGVVSISGTVGHARTEGDGVRARIISSRAGLAGSWDVHNAQVPAEVAKLTVKAGDTVDFVVDCRANSNFDSFTWAPVIRFTEMKTPGAAPAEWNAASGFKAPAAGGSSSLSPWERYAQVLLVSNEFMFAD